MRSAGSSHRAQRFPPIECNSMLVLAVTFDSRNQLEPAVLLKFKCRYRRPNKSSCCASIKLNGWLTQASKKWNKKKYVKEKARWERKFEIESGKLQNDKFQQRQSRWSDFFGLHLRDQVSGDMMIRPWCAALMKTGRQRALKPPLKCSWRVGIPRCRPSRKYPADTTRLLHILH